MRTTREPQYDSLVVCHASHLTGPFCVCFARRLLLLVTLNPVGGVARVKYGDALGLAEGRQMAFVARYDELSFASDGCCQYWIVLRVWR